MVGIMKILNSCRKVKLSLYMLIGVQKVEASRISRQSAHEGGKVVNFTRRPPLPLPPPAQGRSMAPTSFRGWVDTRGLVQPEGLNQRNSSLTPLWIEPATILGLVEHYINQLYHRASPWILVCDALYFRWQALVFGWNLLSILRLAPEDGGISLLQKSRQIKSLISLNVVMDYWVLSWSLTINLSGYILASILAGG
jgi:hypothetical protein